MNRVKSGRIWFILSIIGFFISSVPVVLVSKAIEDDALTSTGYTIGVLFWAGLIVGIACWLIAYSICKKQRGFHKVSLFQKAGIVCFFKNKHAKMADVVMGVSLVLTIVDNFIYGFPHPLNAICLFMFLFSFHMHYLLNGRLYKYLFLETRKRKGD